MKTGTMNGHFKLKPLKEGMIANFSAMVGDQFYENFRDT